MADHSVEKTPRCGLCHVFRRRKCRSTNRSTSNASTPSSKSQKKGHHEPVSGLPASPKARNTARPGLTPRRSPNIHNNAKNQIASQSRSPQVHNQARKTPQPGLSISGELESMIIDHQKSKGGASLVSASSSNFMLYGNLGNLRGPPERSGKPVKEPAPVATKHSMSPSIGNVVRRNEEKPVSLCRAVSTRMDPEQLKILGNEDYRNGNFAEALALYDAAIAIDPNKAAYRSNRSAALVALGKLLEAAFECRESIRIDPFHQRAHNRLGMISVRLGEGEKALYHFKQAGSEADPDAMNKARNIQNHLNKCTEVKRRRDWNALAREADLAIVAGADSAPLVYGLRAEALLKMNKHEEAIETMEKGPNFKLDDSTKFFGPIGGASLLLFHAQVDVVAGRFDSAVASAQRASRLDPNSKEAKTMLRRAKAVATARSNGNELFRSARYSEASIAYTEGLNDSPYNAVLLCNRAACRSKLGQYQKAVEDCSAALNVRSSYSKARLRRADCYAKMEKWGACIQDCEVLLKENPDDEEVGKILKEAKAQLKKNGGSQDINFDDSHATGMVVVSSNECFRDYVTSPGLSVVLFCKKEGDRTIMQLIEQLNQRYPSANFLKVEVEDHPLLAKSEGVNKLPAFVIYVNGSRAREVPGDRHDLLESSIKYYTRR